MPSEIDLFREFIQTETDDELGTPATEEEISQFEARYNVILPEDVKEYFLKINGVGDGGYIALWPLHEWERLVEYQYGGAHHAELLNDNPEHYFIIGNYDIGVWLWSIKLSPNGQDETPVFVTYEKGTKLAGTFTEFLYLFRTQHPESLLGYG
jgi:hypothetical protein